MRAFTMLAVAAMAAACASPEPLPRAQLAPPLQLAAPVDLAGEQEADAGRADRDQSPPVRGTARNQGFDGDGNDLAPSTYRTVIETVEVEVPVEVVASNPQLGSAGPEVRRYSTYDDYLYQRRAYRAGRPTRFPVNTAIGAGVGAIIGNQRGHRGRGALIGGGVGLLFDLNRWTR